MKLIKPSIECVWYTTPPLKTIEKAGRTCYKSEDKITTDSAEIFVRSLLSKGHEAMIEHASASYRVICDRGVTHETIRHRLFSYAQESTRFCNYKGGVTFIVPPWITIDQEFIDVELTQKCNGTEFTQDKVLRDSRWDLATISWYCSLAGTETTYQALLKEGWTPQQARSVLPNSLKTEIVITGNLREWRHFMNLRTTKAAHPQMREIAFMILKNLQSRIPVLFDEYPNEEI